MYAHVITVDITDFEQARRELIDNMQAGIKASPGFQGGTWLAPVDGKGMSVVVFDTEEHAQAVASFITPGTVLNDFVTVASSEVREVVLDV